LDWSEVCFVGDDVVDLGPLKRAGLAVAVADARPEAKAAAHFVTGAPGGAARCARCGNDFAGAGKMGAVRGALFKMNAKPNTARHPYHFVCRRRFLLLAPPFRTGARSKTAS
jgi:3-deoxy-D-manno-octulosonate 8-phosphate phosphatase KdsC-like HAD superfamily phosphatase